MTKQIYLSYPACVAFKAANCFVFPNEVIEERFSESGLSLRQQAARVNELTPCFCL